MDPSANVEGKVWQAGRSTENNDKWSFQSQDERNFVSDSPMRLYDDAELIDHRPRKEEVPDRHH